MVTEKCFKFDVSKNSWSELPATLSPAVSAAGYDSDAEWGLVIAGGLSKVFLTNCGTMLKLSIT